MWHVTCRLKFSHQCINKRHASVAMLPTLNGFNVGFPINVLPIIDAILTKDLVALLHAPPSLIVSPKELIDEVFNFGLVCPGDFMVDVSD